MAPSSDNVSQTQHHRTIRSFILRQGRLTSGQQRALDEQWPTFGLDYQDTRLDLEKVFGRSAPKVLEIGFGNGDSLCQMAREHPDRDYLGIEVHRPGVGHLLQLIEQYGLSNIRVMCHDAIDILQHQISDRSLDRVQLFFPDPWHKKKHNKRRIVQPAFIELLARKIKAGGYLHMATDWQDYAKHMLNIMQADNHFENLAKDQLFSPRPANRPLTKFEARGQRLGHGVWDLMYQRKPTKTD